VANTARLEALAPRVGIATRSTQDCSYGYGRSFDIGVFGSLSATRYHRPAVLAHQTLNSATFDNKTPVQFHRNAGFCCWVCGVPAGSVRYIYLWPHFGHGRLPVIPATAFFPCSGQRAACSPRPGLTNSWCRLFDAGTLPCNGNLPQRPA